MHCYACFPTTVTHLPPCSTQDAESKGDGNGKPLAHTHAADFTWPRRPPMGSLTRPAFLPICFYQSYGSSQCILDTQLHALAKS